MENKENIKNLHTTESEIHALYDKLAESEELSLFDEIEDVEKLIKLYRKCIKCLKIKLNELYDEPIHITVLDKFPSPTDKKGENDE